MSDFGPFLGQYQYDPLAYNPLATGPSPQVSQAQAPGQTNWFLDYAKNAMKNSLGGGSRSPDQQGSSGRGGYQAAQNPTNPAFKQLAATGLSSMCGGAGGAAAGAF